MATKRRKQHSVRRKLREIKKRFKSKFNEHKQSAKELLAATFVGLSIATFIVSATVFGPTLHESYLINKLSPAVVKITGINNFYSGGTGFQLDTKGGPRIITNSHVCMGTHEEGYVMLHTTKPEAIKKIIKIDPIADLCMIEGLDGTDALELGSRPDIRDEVAVLGHPLLQPQTFSKGRIVAREVIEVVVGTVEEGQQCQGPGAHPDPFIGLYCMRPYLGTITTALIYPGNSGSPVVNFWGEVVGVVFAGNSRTNHGIFVPYNNLKKFVQGE